MKKRKKQKSESMDSSGNFIKEELFENIWIDERVNEKYSTSKALSDDDYIDYLIWEDINENEMYKKHLPKVKFYRGETPNIIFHGGCIGCLSQRKFGIDRCKRCFYFKFDGCKPDLKIDGEESAKMNNKQFNNLLKNLRRKK